MTTKHFITAERYDEQHRIGTHRFDPNWDDENKIPPQWVLDRAADDLRDQGWTRQLRPSNICPICFEAIPKNGECSCTD